MVTKLIMKMRLLSESWKPSGNLDEWDVLDQEWVFEHY